MTLTLVIRRPAASGHAGMSRDEMEQAQSADPHDLETVTNFAKAHGLSVSEASAVKRSVQVEGTSEQLAAIFGAGIPDEISGIVMAALGLNQSAVAKPHNAT